MYKVSCGPSGTIPSGHQIQMLQVYPLCRLNTSYCWDWVIIAAGALMSRMASGSAGWMAHPQLLWMPWWVGAGPQSGFLWALTMSAIGMVLNRVGPQPAWLQGLTMTVVSTLRYRYDPMEQKPPWRGAISSWGCPPGGVEQEQLWKGWPGWAGWSEQVLKGALGWGAWL